MFQRIVVPLDGSARAERAIAVAVRLARASGGSLVLLRVADIPLAYEPALYASYVSQTPFDEQGIQEMELAKARVYLAGVAQSAQLAGIKVETQALPGEPAPAILGFLGKEGDQLTDLVILCSHGRTSLAHWVLGSVAHTLVHQSTVPLLVLRQQERPPFETGRPLRTLVPLDGSQLSETAIAPALALTAALAAPERGTLQLVQVVKDLRSAVKEGYVSEWNEEAHRLARSYLVGVAERIEAQQPGGRLSLATSVEVASDVASALLGVAEQAGSQGCDLIAISTHGRHGLQRWVMGSVTDRLLTTTHLPMLIVRPQKNH